MEILSDFELFLTVDDILRGQGGEPQVLRNRKPALMEAAEHALEQGLDLLHPVVLIQEANVLSLRHDRILLQDSTRLTGPLVTRHLAGAQKVVAVVCTIGLELEEAVTRLLGEDPLYALALDGLGNAAVASLAQQACSRIEAQVLAEGLMVSTPLSPGNPEWPVEVGQPQIFSLVDPMQARIQLTSGGMMHPKKSMSFVIGLGAEMSQANPCEMCSLNSTCRYQYV